MKKISYLFIGMGILIALYPFINRIYGGYWENKLLAELNENEAIEVEDRYIEDIVRTNYDDLSEVLQEPQDVVQENTYQEEKIKLLKEDSTTTIGIIEVPKINLTLPILEGTTKKNLSRGAGHITGTSMPGKIGNSAIAAHRAHTYGRFFNRLNELEVGDEIIIKIDKEVFVYTVYDKVVVDPSDLSVLKGNKEDKIVTLITCDPLYKATHRLVIHCKIIS